MKSRQAYTIVEVLAAVVVVSVGFAGVLNWLQGHAAVLAREQRSLALQREAQNVYERSMAFPTRLTDSTWEYAVPSGERFHAQLQVLDSLDWPADSLYRPWPREATLTICAQIHQDDCPVRLFFAAGGVDNDSL